MMSKRDRQTSSAATEQKIGPAANSTDGAGSEQPQPEWLGNLPSPEEKAQPVVMLAPAARIRLRAKLWRAAIELGTHPAAKHIEAMGNNPPQTNSCPAAQELADIIATLRLMHAPAVATLEEAVDILAGR